MSVFSKFSKELEHRKNYMLHDASDFLAFVVASIIGVLIFYRQTQDEFTSILILSLLWYFFWRESDMQGKILLVAASAIGYVHELIGVKVGFFTYLDGFFGGVPLWVLPGYGAIFWASYNFWRIFEETYRNEKWFSKIPYAAAAITALLVAVDSAFFGFLLKPLMFSAEIILSFLLFRSLAEVRLAYFVAAFTVFDEIAGELIGTWHHSIFSIFSLMSGYVFLLWMSLTIKELLQGTKKWSVLEVVSALAYLGLFAADVWKRVW